MFKGLLKRQFMKLSMNNVNLISGALERPCRRLPVARIFNRFSHWHLPFPSIELVYGENIT